MISDLRLSESMLRMGILSSLDMKRGMCELFHNWSPVERPAPVVWSVPPQYGARRLFLIQRVSLALNGAWLVRAPAEDFGRSPPDERTIAPPAAAVQMCREPRRFKSSSVVTITSTPRSELVATQPINPLCNVSDESPFVVLTTELPALRAMNRTRR